VPFMTRASHLDEGGSWGERRTSSAIGPARVRSSGCAAGG
jgi:hypothetical protein